MATSRLHLSLLAAAIVSVPASSHAYSGNSEVSEPCHETITLAALSRVRTEAGLAPTLVPHGEDRALVNDLPVNMSTDLAGATLILANRDVDLNGNEPDDLDKLAPVHGSPDNQRKHCLRAPTDDEPDGTAQAVAACREGIRSLVEKSLAGLAADGSVDPNRRTVFEAVLDIRGPVDAPLPTFYVEMGRALHALQDAFSHQWRTDGHRKVITVLNYADVVNDKYQESRDGPPHSSMLDECKGLDAFRLERLEVVKNASKELMVAALAPAANDAERMLRVDAVLDEYFQLQTGCTADNNWCDAQENKYRDEPGCVCSTQLGSGSWWAAWPFLLGGVMLFARRRRQRGNKRALGAALTAGFLFVSPKANAQGAEPESAVNVEESPGTDATPAEIQPVDPKVQPRPEAICVSGETPLDISPDSENRVEPFPLGVVVAGGGALANAAVAVSLGLRYRFSGSFLVGLDGEYNPWFSRTTKDFRSGTTNVYATLIARFPMSFERLNVRSTLQLGVSRMNFDLYGVPKGTVGPYVGFSFLGVDFELARSIYLVLDPAHIAMPIPQTTGVPFSYPQYRVTLGLQFGA